MTTQCCVCKSIRVNGVWGARAKDELPTSHTYCPSCLAAEVASIKRQRLNGQIHEAQGLHLPGAQLA
ncbi:MAG: hypothetical protein IT368_17845 [Candidatus Hydrogenedentes bacterium]|nr:hypothetical protein [Candidatus Hydrogenedentota bacterium]